MNKKWIGIGGLTATSVVVAAFALCVGCGSSGGGSGSDSNDVIVEQVGGGAGNGADLVLKNAHVYTVNASQARAEAVAIKNGKISFVGSDADVSAMVDGNTRVLNLSGRMVLPGMHDVHMHPLEAGSSVGSTCLLEADTDPEEFVSLFPECAPNQKGTEWVLGGGYSIHSMLETTRLPIDILDDGIADKPAIMLEQTSHSVWANSKALEAAGITASTPNPAGGVIDKDPDTGALTGLLIDNAGNLLFHEALSPKANRPNLSELTYQGLLFGLEEMAKNGITSASDARAYWQRDHIDVWKRALSEDTLTARVALGLWAYPEMDDAEQIAALKALYEDNAASLLRINQIKFYSDGIIDNGTAALLAPYNETPGFTGNTGLNYFTASRLQSYITALETTGFTAHIHAIGDRGVREALTAIENAATANGTLDRRHRLSHLEMVDSADIARFKQLGVIADFQVAGDFTKPENRSDFHTSIGQNRASRLIPLGEMHRSGARVTLSSDWDVSSINPFVGIQNALTRGSDGLPDLGSAIRAYTINAAYAMKQEGLVGSIEVGKEADLIVIDRDLTTIPNSQISETKVLLTLLAGEAVFQTNGF